MRQIAVLFLAAALLAGCVPSVYDQPYPVAPVELPRDDAAHAAPIEWWYWVGHLEDGRRPRARLPAHLLRGVRAAAAAAPGDPLEPAAGEGHRGPRGRRRPGRRTARHGPALRRLLRGRGVDGAARRVRRRLARHPRRRRREPRARLHGRRLRLRTRRSRPPSRPRSTATRPASSRWAPAASATTCPTRAWTFAGRCAGRCAFPVACAPEPVVGQAWFDHQWGDFRVDALTGWDWFALQLDDGAEVMLYLIRDETGGYVASAGSYVTADGRTLRPRGRGLRDRADRGELDQPGHRCRVPGGLARDGACVRRRRPGGPTPRRSGDGHARHHDDRLLGRRGRGERQPRRASASSS